MRRRKRVRRRRRSPVKWVIGLLVLCALAAGWLYVHGKMVQWERTAEAYRTFAGTEKDWILSCQTDDGLILYRQWDPEEYREEQTVFPYFSTIAALGLLSGTVTEEHAEGALRYQQWYLNHLNTSAQDLQNGRGTVSDCRVIREGASLREESLQTYDSVDSYAAMFLLLVDRYAQAVSDELLFSRTEDILLVLEALLNTIGPNGLSYAKSEYPVQYLMDNSEVYAGLCAAARILERMDPSGQLEQVRTMALQLREAMDLLLWNHTGGHYEVGLFEGDLLDFDGWTSFYPDGVCQLFPLCFGVLSPDSERAAQLYDQFCRTWSWERLEHQRRDINSFYWCAIGYAAAIMQDETRLTVYMDQYRDGVTQAGRAYPLYTGEAGWMAMACGHMEEAYRQRLQWTGLAHAAADWFADGWKRFSATF